MTYSLIVLDCDGVVLDSNQIKSNAMQETVAHYPPCISQKFLTYHRRNGGISRYEKFDYLLRNIVCEYSDVIYHELLGKFSNIVKRGLLQAEFTYNAVQVLQQLSKTATLMIVSGGDEQEIRKVFTQREIKQYFTEIYGCPLSKDRHCKNINSKISSTTRKLFIGDSQLDYQTALDHRFDFVFISGYTDFEDWQEYCVYNDIVHYADLSEFLQHYIV